MKTFMGFLGLVLITFQVHAGTVLITEQEASLPSESIVYDSRGITRGPRIELVQPGATSSSPLHFQLKFRSFGGVAIDTQSLHVVYLKKPEVDITSRVARFAQAAGVDIPDAEVPVGEHYLRVEVADLDGRTRRSVFSLKVTP
jgi:hypothetical protein